MREAKYTIEVQSVIFLVDTQDVLEPDFLCRTAAGRQTYEFAVRGAFGLWYLSEMLG